MLRCTLALLVLLGTMLSASFAYICDYTKCLKRNGYYRKPENIFELKCTINEPEDDELSRLFQQIEDMDPQDIPMEVQQAIENKIKENGPNELQVRLKLLGITPITLVGFALAVILLSLNNILGAGWVGEFFGSSRTNSLSKNDNISDRDRAQQSQLMKKLQGDAVINYDDIYMRLKLE